MNVNKILSILFFALISAVLIAQPSVPFEKVQISSAFASSEYTHNGRYVENLINGSGLDAEGNHSNDVTTMWSAQQSGFTHHTLIFQLNAPQKVIGIHIWNGNWTPYLDRGVKNFDIYYSTSNNDLSVSDFSMSEWEFVRHDILAQASGLNDYKGEYKDLPSLPSNVRWLGLDIKVVYNGNFSYATMSEVQAYKPKGEDPNTATISGTAAIVKGDSSLLTIEFTGTTPFAIKYTDGSSEFEITTNDYYYQYYVTPDTTSLYELVSVSDLNGAGTVSGSATIAVYPPEEILTSIESQKYRITYNKLNKYFELKEIETGSVMDFSPVFYLIRNPNKPSVSESSITENFNYKTINVAGNINYLSSKTGNFYLLTPSDVKNEGGKLIFIMKIKLILAFLLQLSFL